MEKLSVKETAEKILDSENWTGHTLRELASFGRIGNPTVTASDWTYEYLWNLFEEGEITAENCGLDSSDAIITIVEKGIRKAVAA